MPDDTLTAELIAAALPEQHTWRARPVREDLTRLPNCAAVLLFVDAEGRAVQLLTTQQLKRLAFSRLTAPVQERRGRADLAEVVRGVRWRRIDCPFEGRWRFYRVARLVHARDYRRLMSFGPAWFLHVDWSQRVPELRVTERVWDGPGESVGPWPTRRACQEALEGLWDVFDLCRYPEQVRRAPRGQRCAYADMGRCDAPCDGSVALQAYAARCRAAWRFAAGGVGVWVGDAAQRMREAAGRQDYELAGRIKQHLEFAERWQEQWSRRICRVAELNYLLLLPATRRRAWKVMLACQGEIIDGPVVRHRNAVRSVVAWFPTVRLRAPEELPGGVRMEQTWLLCQLLMGSDADDAGVLHLPGLELPDGFMEAATTRLNALRPGWGASSAAGGESGKNR